MSDTATPLWSFAHDFATEFSTSRTALQSRVESSKSTLPAPQPLIQDLQAEYTRLGKLLADATGSLPSYEQKKYELQLKALETSIEHLRTSSNPKSKFAFKRKAAVTTGLLASPVTPASQTPSPSPLTPVPTPTPPIQSDVSAALPTRNATISSRSREYITLNALPSTLPNSSDLTISDLDRCIINLLPIRGKPDDASDMAPTSTREMTDSAVVITSKVSAVHIRNVTRSVLLLPTINGSVLAHDLSDCFLAVGCHQYRMHTSKDTTMLLSIPSNPIIEHCSGIRFGAYPNVALGRYHSIPESKHHNVQDFSHIRATPSPNWSAIHENDDGEGKGVIDREALTAIVQSAEASEGGGKVVLDEELLERLVGVAPADA